eukprot:3413-Heterococcus_DN1.PRE.2
MRVSASAQSHNAYRICCIACFIVLLMPLACVDAMLSRLARFSKCVMKKHITNKRTGCLQLPI